MTRLNKYVAGSSSLSRREADTAISAGRITINDAPAELGTQVGEGDLVKLDGNVLRPAGHRYIILNKPVGYVCSRRQQGNTPTIYKLLPPEFTRLNPVGRLDKDSSGLLLLTDDGDYAQKLTHPSYRKDKLYEITIDRELKDRDQNLLETGIELSDGPSKMHLEGRGVNWRVTISEGRNRQIRRSFEALNYRVVNLHRTNFGPYRLDNLESGKTREVTQL